MRTVLNYIGQLRVYSLVDLILLLIAVEATSGQFVGVLCLHVGFLSYLESTHAHNGRATVPKWVWIVLVLVGLSLYQKMETIPFLLASFFYTKKAYKKWGIWAPFFRGLQLFFLVAGICGYGIFLPWVAFVVSFVRNTIGDWRDVEKDKEQRMITLPILVGVKKDLKWGHLVAIILSSSIWWSFTGLSIHVLVGVILVQLVTYNLTPR